MIRALIILICLFAITPVTAQSPRLPGGLAERAIAQGDYRSGMQYLLSDAAECERETGSPRWCLNIYQRLVATGFVSGDYRTALTYARALVAELERDGDARLVAIYLMPYADAARLNGQYGEQRRALRRSIELFAKAPQLDSKNYARACGRLMTTGWYAMPMTTARDSDAAIKAGEGCLRRLLREPKAPAGPLSVVRFQLGRTHLDRADYASSQAEFARAVRYLSEAKAIVDRLPFAERLLFETDFKVETDAALARAMIGAGLPFDPAEALMMSVHRLGMSLSADHAAIASDLAFEFYRTARRPLRARTYLDEAIRRYREIALARLANEQAAAGSLDLLRGRYRRLVELSWRSAQP